MTSIRGLGGWWVWIAVAACGGTRPERPAPTPSPTAVTDSQPLAAAGAVQAGPEAAGDRAHYESVLEMLRGKAPGVQVIEVAPGQFQVRIRGVNQSLQATGQEPLVVLDGVASSRPAGQLLMSLNPQDVVRIEVLRDVASTAVYGVRGANGVLIVQTRRRR
jgi:TonB-dependent SusC/RagA subfamily outer membrane receptor